MKNKINAVVRTIKHDIGAWVLILPALLCVYFCIVRPQVLACVWSFFDMKGYTPTDFVGFDNYRIVLSDTEFIKTFINTLLYVGYSIIVGFIPPIIVAIVMNEMVHLRKLTRVVIYMPSVIPAVAVSLLWYFMYSPDQTGLLNMLIMKLGGQPYAWLQDGRFTILYITISMAWSSIGGTAIYYFAILQGVNRELYEAAIIDGAGFFSRLKVVTFPHMNGAILLFLVRHIVGVFSVMEQPLQMTDGGPNNASVSLGLLNYRYAFMDGKPQYAMALSVIMFIMLIWVTIGYFKLSNKMEDNL